MQLNTSPPKRTGCNRTGPGRIWLNPPYSTGLVDKFVTRLVESAEVKQAILLVNNATDTGWFHLAASHATSVCFHRGRIAFVDAKGVRQGSPNHGQVLFYFGSRVKSFEKYFADKGLCMRLAK